MTPEQIIEMASRAGFFIDTPSEPMRIGVYHQKIDGELQAFAQLVRNVALEESALLCDARSERGSPAAAADEAGLIGEQIRSLKS